jgi:hypothetical protein
MELPDRIADWTCAEVSVFVNAVDPSRDVWKAYAAKLASEDVNGSVLCDASEEEMVFFYSVSRRLSAPVLVLFSFTSFY